MHTLPVAHPLASPLVLPCDVATMMAAELSHVGVLASRPINGGLPNAAQAVPVDRTLFAKSVVLPFALWEMVLATWGIPTSRTASRSVRDLQPRRRRLRDDDGDAVARAAT